MKVLINIYALWGIRIRSKGKQSNKYMIASGHENKNNSNKLF